LRALIQRVSHASVEIGGAEHAAIGKGLLVLLGIAADDEENDLSYLASKIAGMRIFSDEEGKMNLDIRQISGEILVVSQFTLQASTKKGNRPSFITAAAPENAIPLYEKFKSFLGELIGKPCKSGLFGANMQVALLNDGPVTIWLDSRNKE
jgi:D-aminoacyl-tRNA deacylase